MSGLTGFERNLHAQDAPVSFPPIWTVPWFQCAQYDASIEQPLIRNAGEALGVFAQVNLSPDASSKTLFRSSVTLENLARIEEMLRGPDLSGPSFGGLQPPKWPSEIFPDDPSWKIDPARVSRGRAVYAEICVECHLGPVNDPVFDKQYPDKSFWSSTQWDAKNEVLKSSPEECGRHGNELRAGRRSVLANRRGSRLPGHTARARPRKVWGCPDLPASSSSTEMPFSIALMIVVDRTSRKWMEDHNVPEPDRALLWGSAKELSQSNHCEGGPLSRAPAERRLGHRSLPSQRFGSLALLDAHARGRATQTILHGLARLRSAAGWLSRGAGRSAKLQQGRNPVLGTNPDGSPIHGNSVLGHSLEGTPGPGKGVIGRTLTEDERYDLIEYLKTL